PLHPCRDAASRAAPRRPPDGFLPWKKWPGSMSGPCGLQRQPRPVPFRSFLPPSRPASDWTVGVRPFGAIRLRYVRPGRVRDQPQARFGFASVALHTVEAGIGPVRLRQQCLVSAFLHQTTIFKDDDMIGVDHGREPVCDDDCGAPAHHRSEEHTSELQSRENLVCRLLLEKKKKKE